MLSTEMVRMLFKYNQWADRRLLDACSKLTDEEFARDLGSSFKSIRDTWAHIHGGLSVWHERVAGRSPATLPTELQQAEFSDVRVKLEQIDEEYIRFVSGLSESRLAEVITYKVFSGAEFSSPLWQILHTLSNHGTYHRGQVVTMLRQLGAKPATTDAIAYYREIGAPTKTVN